VVRVLNVFPGLNSYKPVGTLTSVSNALDGRPRGAITFRDADSIVRQYAGDASKLYELSANTWDDRSKSGGYITGDQEAWEFTNFKNQILATNYSDAIQQITPGATAFSDLTTDFRARTIAAVGNFVFAGNTFDTTDDAVPDRIRWSAFNNAADWTVDAATGSGVADLKTGGAVLKIIGGEVGVIVCEKATFRVTFAGAPKWHEIRETIPGLGALSKGAVSDFGGTVFLWSEQGFFAVTGGTKLHPIGANKVDDFARNDLVAESRRRISSAVDPRTGRVYWAYPGEGSSDGQPNKILVYDPKLDKWSYIEQITELLWGSGGSAITVDDAVIGELTVDSLDDLIDSDRWSGDAPQFAAFDSSYQSGYFNGSAMAAEIDTQERELTSGLRSQLLGVRPLVDGGAVTVQAATRNLQTDTEAFSSAASVNSSGIAPIRKNARYFRFRAAMSGDWDDAIGIQIDPMYLRAAQGR